MTDKPAHELRWTSAPEHARAVVLVIHGGASRSTRRPKWTNLAILRLLPFATALARDDRLAVVRLKLSVRGWNETGDSAIADARWALDTIRRRYPGIPIGIVGHSLGGRIALRAADEPGVEAVAALAAWVEATDPVPGRRGQRFLLIHGTADRMTDPRGSQLLAAAIARRGADAAYEPIEGEKHALLRHAGELHRRVATWMGEALLSPCDAPGRTS